MSLSLRSIRHPLKSIDMLTKSNLKILHHLSHAHLVAFREILLHIDLTHCLRKESVRDSHRTFPAWTHLLLTRHLATEEIEMSRIELIAHISCST